MTKPAVKTLKWIGLVSGAGLIAISASAFASTSALAAAPSVSTNQQILSEQQKQQPKNQKVGQQPQPQLQTQQPKNQKITQQPQPQLQTQQPENQKVGQQPQPQLQTQQPKNQKIAQQPQPQLQTQQPKNQKIAQQPQLQSRQPKNPPSQRYDWAAYQPGQRPPQWQQYHQDFNPQPYQWNRTSNQRYHYQAYVEPQGWYAQRWMYGQILPALFWGRNYWLTDYSGFGLIDPPYGYVWVRNGNDALLIDVETGQILSVEYGVFYA